MTTTTTEEANMAAFTITAAYRKTRGGSAPSLVFDLPGTAGHDGAFAEVQFADGSVQALSRLDGETSWTVDTQWRAGCSMPTFHNGFGSRCTMLVKAAPEVAAALDARQVRA